SKPAHFFSTQVGAADHGNFFNSRSSSTCLFSCLLCGIRVPTLSHDNALHSAFCMPSTTTRPRGSTSILSAPAVAALHRSPFTRRISMAKCETCGNEYEKTFDVMLAGHKHTFEHFEGHVQPLGPTCERGARVG